MRERRSIVDQERSIQELLSVVQRDYSNKKERQRKQQIHRKQDIMIYIQEGESFYEFEDFSVQLKAGDVAFIARDCCYQKKIRSEKHRAIYVYFNFDEQTENLPPYEIFHGLEGVEMSFLRLYKKWSSRDVAHKSESMSLFYQLYAQIIRGEQPAYLPQSKQKLFNEVIRIILKTYTDAGISILELAERAGMSEVHFRRCFRKIYKVSPQEYITTLRLNYAKECLQYSDHSMEEIANSSGFPDSGYFSRVFKKKTGYTPSEYRKKFESRND